jgi:DNA-binding response OmpR family regulator
LRTVVALSPDPNSGRLPIPAPLISAFEASAWAVAWSSKLLEHPRLSAADHPAAVLFALQRIEPDFRARLLQHRACPASARPLAVALCATPRMEVRLELLEAGADLALPLDAEAEWICRQVQSVVELVSPPPALDELSLGALTLRPGIKRLVVLSEGRPRETPLSPTECRIVSALMIQPYRALGRDELLRAVWGADSPIDPRTIDVHVRRLRRALGRIGCAEMLQTVRGVGYRLAPD